VCHRDLIDLAALFTLEADDLRELTAALSAYPQPSRTGGTLLPDEHIALLMAEWVLRNPPQR
jgi:hypothetical protein